MRDFPSCFGENGVQIVDSSSNAAKNPQNVVACVYQTDLGHRACRITITWSRTLTGQGFSISVEDCSSKSICKAEIKPWLFSKRKGSKSLDADRGKVEVFWDLSAAKFGSGPEPMEAFYVAVVFDLTMVLLLGDLSKEAYRKTSAAPPPSNATLVTKREHVFGKRSFCTRARFSDNGKIHDVAIECDTNGQKDPYLEIRIDKKRAMQVRHLRWKFRGNQTIIIDGLSVEVCWDVHGWFFGAPVGNAVFLFQTGLSTDKLLFLPCSQTSRDKQQLRALGFSLILYAWRNE